MVATDLVATDLHGHSFFSDGGCWPEQYVATRRTRGLSVIALSDHDSFAGITRASRAAADAGIVCVPAMEASSFIGFGSEAAEQIHILAYFPPSMLADGSLWHTRLAHRAALMRRLWREHVLGWLDSLPAYDSEPLDHDAALSAASDAGFPALQAMINLVHDRNRLLLPAFHAHQRRFWHQGKLLFGWQPEELIDTIRADGGLDVVAHPVRVRDRERMQRVLEYASGLEAYTSRHKPEVAREFREWAESRAKHWTASVDDHQRGDYTPPPIGTPRATVERILGGAGKSAGTGAGKSGCVELRLAAGM